MPLIQEKYDGVLRPRHEGESEADYQFCPGRNFADYELLDLLHAQLPAFEIPTQELEPVVPVVGQPTRR